MAKAARLAALASSGFAAMLFGFGAPASADVVPLPPNLCMVDLEGPSGADYGHVDSYADPDGGIEREEFYLDFEVWRLTGEEDRDEPEDEISFEATWTLPEGRLDASSELLDIGATADNLRFLGEPMRFVVRLDGKQVSEGRLDPPNEYLYDESVPNPYGYRSMEILLYDADGRLDRRARVKLPDWKRLSAAVLSASRGELYREQCGSDSD